MPCSASSPHSRRQGSCSCPQDVGTRRCASGRTRRRGELYEAKGDLKRAIQRYSDFIALWKDADKSLQPAVQDAKDRVAKLQARIG